MLRIRSFRAYCRALAALAITVNVAAGAPQDSRPRRTAPRQDNFSTVPAGTLISMRMDISLNSRTSRAGDKFTATVTIPVYVDGKAVIPAGAIIEGRVTEVTPAKRMSRSGTIAVEFDDLVFPNGSGMQISGSLTAADPKDRGRIDDESRVSGDKGNQSVVFIGGGAAVGAVLGGIAGGGKGAAAGGAAGAGAGIAAVLLSKGAEAEVRSGSQFGIKLNQSLSIGEDNLSDTPPPSNTTQPSDGGQPTATTDTGDPRGVQPRDAESRIDTSSIDLSSAEMIQRAQAALKEQGYYEGRVDGRIDQRTANALRAYQHDHNLPETGELDAASARNLGLVVGSPSNRTGDDAIPAEILGATATRPSRSSIRVVIHTQANTGGWRWLEEHRINGDKLEISALAIRPKGIATQVMTEGTIEVNLQQGGEGVTSVIIHGAAGDLMIPLRTSAMSSGEQVSLHKRVEELFSDYRQAIGVRESSSRAELSGNRYSDSEVELLFVLSDLLNSARLYSSLRASLDSVSKLRIATIMLARDARRADRVIGMGGNQSFQSIAVKWDSIRQEVLSLMKTMDIRTSEIE